MATFSIPYQDFAYDLAVSPNFSQDNICFVARASGLYRSDDGGRSWRSSYETLQLELPLLTTAVAVSPLFTTDCTVFCGVPGAILRSSDGGKTWQATLLPPPQTLVSALAVSPNYREDGMVLAATLEDGIYVTEDYGTRWVPRSFGLMDLRVFALAFSPDYCQDETVFAGTESGVFRSTNGGLAWRETNFPMEYAPVLCLAASSGFGDDPIVWAGTEDHGLFFSLDGGVKWDKVTTPGVGNTVNAIIVAHEPFSFPTILVLQPEALLVSRDYGRSWSYWREGLPFAVGMTCVAAPFGLSLGALLLVGLEDGTVYHLVSECSGNNPVLVRGEQGLDSEVM